MTIRPVDYTSLIPKTQELSKIKQNEHNSAKNQMNIQIMQQEKQREQNLKTVTNTHETENFTIDANKERGKQKKDNKKNKKEKEKKGGTKEVLGRNIDIRV